MDVVVYLYNGSLVGSLNEWIKVVCININKCLI